MKNADPEHPYTLCPSCGKLIPKDSEACAYCGQRFKAAQVTEPIRKKGRSYVLDTDPTLTQHLLVVICLFFFVFSAVKGRALEEGEISLMKSLFSPNGRIFWVLGSAFSPSIWGEGQFWRLIQYQFLHGGLFHLLFNLSAFSSFGALVLHSFGARRFWLILLTTGIAGGAVSTGWSFFISGQPGNTVGISGALFGFLGALYRYSHVQGEWQLSRRLRTILIQANLFCFFITFLGMRIDNLAHLGGMFLGMFLGGLFAHNPKGTGQIRLEQVVLACLVSYWIFGLFQIGINLNHLNHM
jgi:rhomboid protease GluP